MINLTKIRRSGLWLLSFIAALLTLSPSAGAWDRYAISGDNYPLSDATYFKSGNNYTGTTMSLFVGDWKGGNFKVKARNNTTSEWSTFAPSSNQQLSNDANCGISQDQGGNLTLPAEANGRCVKFTITNYDGNGGSPYNIKANWKVLGIYGDGPFNGWDGDNIVEYSNWTKGSNNWWNYTITMPDNYDNIYFAIAFDGKYYRASSDNTAMNDNQEYTSDEKSGIKEGSAFRLTNVQKGKTYIISFNASDHKVKYTAVKTPTYKLKGAFNDWKEQISFSGTPLTAVVSNYTNTSAGKDSGIILYDSENDKHYANGGTLQNGVAQTSGLDTDGSNMLLASSAEGKDVTFTLTLDSNNKPSTLTARWDNAGSVSFTSLKLMGGLANGNWKDTNKGVSMTANGNEFTKEIEGVDGTTYFCFYSNATGSNRWLIPTNGSNSTARTVTTAGVAYKTASSQSGDDSFLYRFDKSKKYLLTVNASTGLVSITETGSQMTIGIPVLPARVKSKSDVEGWRSITSANPVVYLLGDVINAQRVTPEYEMIRQDNGTYLLDHFAIRWSNVKARVYTSADGTHTDTSNVEVKANDKFSTLRPGVDYKAVYNPSTNTLTLTANPGHADKYQLPPFISLVGYNFQQLKDYETPNKNYNGNTYSNITAKTSTGWQESWIQYDAEGNILKDLDNKVMYNTIWPPKNQVFFKAVKGTETMELNSDNLTFIGQTDENGEYIVKTGAEWKTYLSGNTNYNNLFNASNDNGNDGGVSGLNLDRKYVRYIIPRVWILGATKLWTGWTGRIIGDPRMADWSEHAQWGYLSEKDNEKGSTLTVNTPYRLVADKGNFMFTNPEYFKTVEFFYCVDDNTNNLQNYSHSKSILYTTKPFGAPSIRSQAEDNMHGRYRINVSDLKSTTISKVEIYRYSATKSGVNESDWVMVNSANQQVNNLEDCRVATFEGNWNQTSFNNAFDLWHTDDVQLDPNLAPGKYFYGMTMYFASGDKEEYVKSNPFTIVGGEVAAYQLIKRMDPENDNLGNPEYNYVTFYHEQYNTELQTKAQKAYLLNASVDADKNDADPIFIDYKEIPVDQMSLVDYSDGSKFCFTSKVVIVGTPDENVRPNLIGYKLIGTDASNKDLSEGNYANNQDVRPADTAYTTTYSSYFESSSSDYNRYFRIVEPEFNYGQGFDYVHNNTFQYTYTLRMKYRDTDNSTETEIQLGSVTQTLIIPTPKMVEAHVEMFYGSDEHFNTVNDTYQFNYNEKSLANARYQNLRKVITIENPNVTERFLKKARLHLQYATNQDFENKYAPISLGMFGYRIGEPTEDNNLAAVDLSTDFEPISNTDNSVTYRGKRHEPAEFTTGDFADQGTKTVALVTKSQFVNKAVYFDRWEDGEIRGIKVDSKAPIIQKLEGQTEPEFTVTNHKFGFDTDKHLIETFTVPLKFKTTYYNLSNEVEDLKTLVNNGTHVISEDQTSATLNYVRRYDHNGNLDRAKPLLFGNAIFNTSATDNSSSDAPGYYDYYYLRLKEKDSNGNLKPANVRGETEMVVSAYDLRNGNVEIPIVHDHGTWWDGIDQAVSSNPYYKHLIVEVSYLYPFVVVKDTPSASEAPSHAPYRVDATTNLEGKVLESQATPMSFSGVEIPTSVEGVAAVVGKVSTGVGYIEVSGEDVEVYGADGVKIATGEGRYEVPAGVYVVRLNGGVEKVIVR